MGRKTRRYPRDDPKSDPWSLGLTLILHLNYRTLTLESQSLPPPSQPPLEVVPISEQDAEGAAIALCVAQALASDLSP